jgi:hypothetical protein
MYPEIFSHPTQVHPQAYQAPQQEPPPGSPRWGLPAPLLPQSLGGGLAALPITPALVDNTTVSSRLVGTPGAVGISLGEGNPASGFPGATASPGDEEDDA